MRQIVLLLALACVVVVAAGCCGSGTQGVPKATLYWPLTFGVDAVQPTQQVTQRVPLAPTVQYVPQAVAPAAAAPCYPAAVAPAAAPCYPGQ